MEVKVTVAAIMTAPRHEIVWARNQIQRALSGVNIPLTVSGGVFYGQCMQLMLEDLIRQGNIDYAITIDYDSIFTTADIERLLEVIITRDDIDAVCGIQCRRGKGTMLGTAPGGKMTGPDTKTLHWDGNPIKATTAHFGLTVIDLRKLETIAKPWFWSKPNDEGRWDGEKVDDDVHFWLKWRDAGNSIFIDPRVRIGHLEEMVTTYDEQMQVRHVYPQDWEKSCT